MEFVAEGLWSKVRHAYAPHTLMLHEMFAGVAAVLLL